MIAVTPTRGVWIEIPEGEPPPGRRLGVTPTRGVWIEMMRTARLWTSRARHPHTGGVD